MFEMKYVNFRNETLNYILVKKNGKIIIYINIG